MRVRRQEGLPAFQFRPPKSQSRIIKLGIQRSSILFPPPRPFSMDIRPGHNVEKCKSSVDQDANFYATLPPQPTKSFFSDPYSATPWLLYSAGLALLSRSCFPVNRIGIDYAPVFQIREHEAHQKQLPSALCLPYYLILQNQRSILRSEQSLPHQLFPYQECCVITASFFLAFFSLPRAAPSLVNPMKVLIFVSDASFVCDMFFDSLIIFSAGGGDTTSAVLQIIFYTFN